MRKLVSIIILLSIAWVAKLSYDMWQISRTVPELQQSLLQSELVRNDTSKAQILLMREYHDFPYNQVLYRKLAV